MIHKHVLFAFKLCGEIKNIKKYGNGHINETYVVETDGNYRYIIQSINCHVFKNPKKLMKNILRVTTWLSHQDENYSGIEIIRTKKNRIYYHEKKNYWRCYKFIEQAKTYETLNDLEMIEEAGKAIARFEKAMEDFPLDKLYKSIPDFHNTQKRLQTFLKILKSNPMHLKHTVRKEIRFILSRSDILGIIEDGIKNQTIRLVPTHNDTKLNNIMMCDKTKKSLCLIDLDTVMPGSILYDYGDAIRSMTSIGKEDEMDVFYVDIDMEKFYAFNKGYLEIMSFTLTPSEWEHLVDSSIIITLECAMRFLTDYLEGDVYFQVEDPMQNLRRARVAIRLVQKLEEKKEELEKIIQDIKVKIISNG